MNSMAYYYQGDVHIPVSQAYAFLQVPSGIIVYLVYVGLVKHQASAAFRYSNITVIV